MSVVVAVRHRKMTAGEAVQSLRHNLRERSLTAIFEREGVRNRVYPEKTQENIVWYSPEQNSQISFPNPRSREEVQRYIDLRGKAIKEHYEAQKDSLGRKKTLKRGTGMFSEFLVVFGSDRKRTSREDTPLTDDEIQAIRGLSKEEYASCVQNFIEKLREKGYSNFIVAGHFDEKTPHFHVYCEPYSFEKGLFVVTGGKKNGGYSDYGEELQDMAATAFDSMGFLRGERGSRSRHVPLNKLHKLENREVQLALEKDELEMERTRLENKEKFLDGKWTELEKFARDIGFDEDGGRVRKDAKISTQKSPAGPTHLSNLPER